jgi:hypothetical protein
MVAKMELAVMRIVMRLAERQLAAVMAVTEIVSLENAAW